MRVYTVHVRTPVTDPDRDLVLVKEGFCWPAFFFSVVWALWHRLWLVAAGFVGVHLVWQALAGAVGLDATTRYWVDLLISVGIGTVANDLRRWTLAGRGYVPQGVVSAPDADGAAERFLDRRPDVSTGIGT
jgi:Protein of unknown function (DUF2628)